MLQGEKAQRWRNLALNSSTKKSFINGGINILPLRQGIIDKTHETLSNKTLKLEILNV